MRRRALPLLIALGAALGGCGGDEGGGAPAAATPAPTTAATAAPGQDGGGGEASGTPYIGSLAVDPGDGTLMIGTGVGLYRLAPGERTAERITGRLTTPDGAGEVASNLVVRYAGPGRLLASGHPQGAGALPENLGLIVSGDAGDTWEPVSQLGEVDFHALDARGDAVAGVPAEETRVLVSADRGATFDERTAPDPPVDLDVDPRRPERMALTTEQGLFTSADGGGSWRQRDALTVETHLAWAPDGTLYRVDASGQVKASRDGGESWTDAGRVDGPPTTAAVDGRGRLYVALAGAAIVRSADGGRSFRALTRLGAA